MVTFVSWNNTDDGTYCGIGNVTGAIVYSHSLVIKSHSQWSIFIYTYKTYKAGSGLAYTLLNVGGLIACEM